MRNKWMDDPVVLLAPCILNWESSLSILFAFYLVSALVSRTHWIHISCWGITGGETRRWTAGISWSLCSYRSLLSQHSSPSFWFHLPVTCSETFTSIWLNVLQRNCPEMAPGSEWGTFPCKFLQCLLIPVCSVMLALDFGCRRHYYSSPTSHYCIFHFRIPGFES